MAFGQQSGPPATGRQLQQLLGLLEEAGYQGFRDARGPLGFTQRQGNGKFTRDEADAFIEQLEGAGEAAADAEPASPPPPAASTPPTRLRQPTSDAARRMREAKQETLLRAVPARMLAVELERRGWIVIPAEDEATPGPT